MKYYFGPVNANDLYSVDAFASSDNDNDLFFYGVEFGTNPGGMEEVMIFDSCNRAIPIDIDNVPALIDILKGLLKAKASIDRAEKLQDFICDPDADLSLGVSE